MSSSTTLTVPPAVAASLALAGAAIGAVWARRQLRAQGRGTSSSSSSGSAIAAGAKGADDAADDRSRTTGQIYSEGVPRFPKALQERLRTYDNTRSASVCCWVPEASPAHATMGSLLIATRFAEVSNVHALRAPMGARRQLTFFDEPVHAVCMCPDASKARIAFLRDVGGSEAYQVYVMCLRTGRTWMLSDGKARHGALRWSTRGDRLSFFSTARTGRAWDTYVCCDDEGSEPELVLEADGPGYAAHDWSPDDTRLLVRRYISAVEAELYVLDLTASPRALTQLKGRGEWLNGKHVGGDERVSYGHPLWSRNTVSADGGGFSGALRAGTYGIYYVCDASAESRYLAYMELDASNTVTLDGIVVTPDLAWNVEAVSVSPTGSAVAFIVNEDGYRDVHLMDTRDSYESSAVVLRMGVGASAGAAAGASTAGHDRGIASGIEWHPDGRRFAFKHSTPRSPGDVYVQHLSADMRPLKRERWTESEVGGLDTSTLVVPQLMRYPTFDTIGGSRRRHIPCFVYRPRTPRADGRPFPVVIHMHGGPEGQAVPGFNARYQYLAVELGIVMLDPNVRGSYGYGKAYLQLANGARREDSVRDIGALLDWVDTQDDLDSSRVGVWGGSYGGYMVLACLIHYRSRLRCGVDMVGISNFVTFLKNTQAYRRELRRHVYGDERDPEMAKLLLQMSPTTRAAEIRRPLLIAQGLNDPRVPASESEQMRDCVRANGGLVWYVLARDEGHGFRKKGNARFYHTAAVMFWQRFLLDYGDA